MTNMVNVSVLLDQETLDKVIDLQKKRNVFSRSKMMRLIVDKGLGALEKEAG